MNRKHLGDALDHWKGSVIALLGETLRDVHVVPMLTDTDPTGGWSDAHLRLYARLLRVPRDRIVHSGSTFRASTRNDYFSALRLPGDADVFLDPDNGIAPQGGGNSKHARPTELATLMPPGSLRIVLVYQHAFRAKDYVEASLRRVVADPGLQDVAAFAYNAGAVAMIFVSRSRSRLTEAHRTMARTFEGTTRITEIHDAPPSVP